MKRKWIFTISAVTIAALQFTTPEHTNPAIDATQTIESTTNVPTEMLALFERSCNDCHSNKTNWRWYTYVAPVSWFTVGHVNDGREELNFSVWAGYGDRMKDTCLKAIAYQCKKAKMPLASYSQIHPEAKLSSKEIDMVCEWVSKERIRLAMKQADTSETSLSNSTKATQGQTMKAGNITALASAFRWPPILMDH